MVGDVLLLGADDAARDLELAPRADRRVGSAATMRLCSRANSVCIAVSAMFSFARTSPATTASAGVARKRPVEVHRRRRRRVAAGVAARQVAVGQQERAPLSASCRRPARAQPVEPACRRRRRSTRRCSCSTVLTCWRGDGRRRCPGAAGVRENAIAPKSLRNASSGSCRVERRSARSRRASRRAGRMSWSMNWPHAQPHCVTPFSEKRFWPASLKIAVADDLPR